MRSALQIAADNYRDQLLALPAKWKAYAVGFFIPAFKAQITQDALFDAIVRVSDENAAKLWADMGCASSSLMPASHYDVADIMGEIEHMAWTLAAQEKITLPEETPG